MTGMNRLSIRLDGGCGLVLREPDGRHCSTTVNPGGNPSSPFRPLGSGVTVISSWRTHAARTRGHDGDVPSGQNVEGDMAMGLNGRAAPPGGRLWLVEGTTGGLREVCGRG